MCVCVCVCVCACVFANVHISLKSTLFVCCPQLTSTSFQMIKLRRTHLSSGKRGRGRGTQSRIRERSHLVLCFIFLRVLQWSTFIDRTFCTETDDERRTWIESINKVSKDLAKKQKDEAPQTPSSGGLKPAEGAASPKQGIKVRGQCGDTVCTLISKPQLNN